MKDYVRLTLGPDHKVNFGSADDPDYRIDGDTVEVDKEIAVGLIQAGLAEKVKKTKEAEQNAQ